MSDYYSEDCYAEDEDTFNLREWMDEFNRIRKLNKRMRRFLWLVPMNLGQ